MIYHHTHLGPQYAKMPKSSKCIKRQNYRRENENSKIRYPVNLPDMKLINPDNDEKPVQRGENESIK